MTALSVRHLSKSFGGVRAVDDVSFDVADGEMLALIGPNGAGKSTSFNLVGGQLVPDIGTVAVAGVDVTGLAPRALARRGVGRTFQVAATFASFNVVENVQTALMAHRGETFDLWRDAAHRHREAALDLLARVGMRDAADRPARDLSYGDVKRVELAIALAGDPRLLLMDEPTAGMAAAERDALMETVRALVSATGLSVLFTEHAVETVFAHADRILVLSGGRIIADGDAATIRNDAQVRAVYLGGGRFARTGAES